MARVSARAAARNAAKRSKHPRGELRSLLRDLFDPYRPERHYMRGPGPRWHEKHAATRVGGDAVFPAGLYKPV